MDELAMVYEFEIYDGLTRRWRNSGVRGTLEAISKVGGVAVRSTALPVDPRRLDPAGFVRLERSA
jgi:hypothetical protein